MYGFEDLERNCRNLTGIRKRLKYVEGLRQDVEGSARNSEGFARLWKCFLGFWRDLEGFRKDLNSLRRAVLPGFGTWKDGVRI